MVSTRYHDKPKYGQNEIRITHLYDWKGQVFELLVEYKLHILAHLRYAVVWSVESDSVLDHKADIGNKLVGFEVAWVMWIRIRLLRI